MIKKVCFSTKPVFSSLISQVCQSPKKSWTCEKGKDEGEALSQRLIFTDVEISMLNKQECPKFVLDSSALCVCESPLRTCYTPAHFESIGKEGAEKNVAEDLPNHPKFCGHEGGKCPFISFASEYLGSCCNGLGMIFARSFLLLSEVCSLIGWKS